MQMHVSAEKNTKIVKKCGIDINYFFLNYIFFFFLFFIIARNNIFVYAKYTTQKYTCMSEKQLNSCDATTYLRGVGILYMGKYSI